MNCRFHAGDAGTDTTVALHDSVRLGQCVATNVTLLAYRKLNFNVRLKSSMSSQFVGNVSTSAALGFQSAHRTGSITLSGGSPKVKADQPESVPDGLRVQVEVSPGSISWRDDRGSMWACNRCRPQRNVLLLDIYPYA